MSNWRCFFESYCNISTTRVKYGSFDIDPGNNGLWRLPSPKDSTLETRRAEKFWINVWKPISCSIGNHTQCPWISLVVSQCRNVAVLPIPCSPERTRSGVLPFSSYQWSSFWRVSDRLMNSSVILGVWWGLGTD